MAIKCASDLAEYQSPKFRAIAVRVDDIPATAPSLPPEDGSVLPFPRDPVAASRLYLQLMSAVDEKT
jgi:hypothetical protein